MKPLQHARITGRHYGGEWQDWIAIHDWIDRSKAIFPSMQHRMFIQCCGLFPKAKRKRRGAGSSS